MTEYLLLLIGTVLVNNFVLVKFLGLCPFMGVSGKLETAIGMGLATTFVMTLASASSYLVAIHLDDKLVDYIHSIAEATREHRFISAGISTRGAISMCSAARAAAYLDERDYVIPEDVKTTAAAVAAHRLILHSEHQSLDKGEVLSSILTSIPVPML